MLPITKESNHTIKNTDSIQQKKPQTNLNASELESAYGDRLRSRFRESFNLICLESGDKRA